MNLVVASLAVFGLVSVLIYLLAGFDLYSPSSFVVLCGCIVIGFPVALLMGMSWQVGLACGPLADMIWRLRSLLDIAFDHLSIEVRKASTRRTR